MSRCSLRRQETCADDRFTLLSFEATDAAQVLAGARAEAEAESKGAVRSSTAVKAGAATAMGVHARARAMALVALVAPP